MKNVDAFDVILISEKGAIRYIFDVDLECPKKLHASHNDPSAPEKLAVSYEMLSIYCKNIAYKYGTKVDDVKKLIPNLGSETNYLLHYRDLQLYLSLRMKVTKIHIVLKFKQSDWMKKYIDFNTGKRTNAANNFQKDILKLMINSVYGKTIEDLRKRINVRLGNNEKDFLKYSIKPTHITYKIFGKNYAAIHEIKPVLTLKNV